MIVLDASAIIAVLFDEPGSDEVVRRMDGALLSSVNLAEVLQKAAFYDVDATAVRRLLGETQIGIAPFDDRMALDTAELGASTKQQGLSLGDRACLALGLAVNGIAVTMDRGWAGLVIPGVQIHVVTR